MVCSTSFSKFGSSFKESLTIIFSSMSLLISFPFSMLLLRDYRLKSEKWKVDSSSVSQWLWYAGLPHNCWMSLKCFLLHFLQIIPEVSLLFLFFLLDLLIVTMLQINMLNVWKLIMIHDKVKIKIIQFYYFVES